MSHGCCWKACSSSARDSCSSMHRQAIHAYSQHCKPSAVLTTTSHMLHCCYAPCSAGLLLAAHLNVVMAQDRHGVLFLVPSPAVGSQTWTPPRQCSMLQWSPPQPAQSQSVRAAALTPQTGRCCRGSTLVCAATVPTQSLFSNTCHAMHVRPTCTKGPRLARNSLFNQVYMHVHQQGYTNMSGQSWLGHAEGAVPVG